MAYETTFKNQTSLVVLYGLRPVIVKQLQSFYFTNHDKTLVCFIIVLIIILKNKNNKVVSTE